MKLKKKNKKLSFLIKTIILIGTDKSITVQYTECTNKVLISAYW